MSATPNASGEARPRRGTRLRDLVTWLVRAQVSSAARERRDTMVLLLAVAFVALPHVDHLPIWASAIVFDAIAFGTTGIVSYFPRRKRRPIAFSSCRIGTSCVTLSHARWMYFRRSADALGM